MNVLELFSGNGSFSKVCKEQGDNVFEVDIDKTFNPDLVKDVLELSKEDIPFKEIDILWASPPCIEYSHAKRTGKRDIEKANKLVLRTLELIKELKPKIWIIENPQTGLLKNQSFMKDLPFVDISYCKYGFPYRKQTRLWTNLKFNGKVCKKDCEFMDGKKHIISVGNARAMYCLKDIKKINKEKFSGEAFELIERLTKHGVNKKDKYKVPRLLCLEIYTKIKQEIK